MHASGSQLSYYPFPLNWHAESNWRREIARSPKAVRRAISGYQRVLTKKSIFAQSWVGHPLAMDYLLVHGRWRMLETGLTLARLSNLGDYPSRLLDATKYVQTAAELRAAVLLRRMGFSVVHEPSNVGVDANKRKKGPDWLALHGGGGMGVEVKCPEESPLSIARQKLGLDLVFRSQELLGDKLVNIEIPPEFFAENVIRDWPNLARAEELLLDGLVANEHAGVTETPVGRISPTPTGFAAMIGPIAIDEAHEVARLGGLLQRAANQLHDWGPGVVILDSSLDRSLMRRCCAVAQSMSEPWASRLGAVLLVRSDSPGFVVTAVPGPLWPSLPPIRGHSCERGHFHVSVFGRNTQCKRDSQLDDYPAFCVEGRGHFVLQKQKD